MNMAKQSRSSCRALPVVNEECAHNPTRSPFLAQNGVFQPLLKYLKHIGPPTLRSSLMNWLPMPELKRLKDVVETMDTEANHIYQHKKNALEAGEESVVRQVGEGKDIMSILCELSEPFLLPMT